MLPYYFLEGGQAMALSCKACQNLENPFLALPHYHLGVSGAKWIDTYCGSYLKQFLGCQVVDVYSNNPLWKANELFPWPFVYP
jgi:hypothetical protein